MGKGASILRLALRRECGLDEVDAPFAGRIIPSSPQTLASASSRPSSCPPASEVVELASAPASVASSYTWLHPAAPAVGSSPEPEEQDELEDATMLVAAAPRSLVRARAQVVVPAESPEVLDARPQDAADTDLQPVAQLAAESEPADESLPVQALAAVEPASSAGD